MFRQASVALMALLAAPAGLDFLAPPLGAGGRALPAGYRPGPMCLAEAPLADCEFFGDGARIVVFEGRVTQKEVLRQDGAFRRPLPYGLTGAEGPEGVIGALEKRGVRLQKDPTVPNGLVSEVLGPDEGRFTLYFGFDRNDRLDLVGITLTPVV